MLSKIESFTSRYPKSSIKYMPNHLKSEDLKELEHKPLLSNGWLIIFKNNSFKDSYLKSLRNLFDKNLILIQITNEVKSTELLSLLESEKIEFRFINNYKLKKDDLISYICLNIKISKSDATFLCDYCNWYLPKLLESVQTLSILDKCTRKDIRKYIDGNKNIAVFDLVNYMLGISKGIHYRDCLALVWDYRYGFEHLVKSVIKQLYVFFNVFVLISEGEIDLTNYKSVEIRNKEIATLNKYRLYKIIEAFDAISLDYLYLLITKLEQIQFNYSGIFDFIAILKWNSDGVINGVNVTFAKQGKQDLKMFEEKLKQHNSNRYSEEVTTGTAYYGYVDGISENILKEIIKRSD